MKGTLRMGRCRGEFAAVLLAMAGAAHGQTDGASPSGQTAQSSSGQVGQRLTREVPLLDTNPMQRISSRIQNRVPSRIQSRLDRFYQPDVATAERFGTAATSAQGSRPRRR